MEIKTFEDLIDWTRQMHAHLGHCFNECAQQNPDERARLLLEYLTAHERELETIVLEFERQADPKAMETRLYDWLEHKPIKSHQTCDGHYANLSYDEICREVFDLHDQIIGLFRDLSTRATIPEAKALTGSLLEMEENESMRLAQQVNRGTDF